MRKFPLICFGHGYLISGIWYEHIVDMIVPEGFLMVFPASEAGLFPSHRTLAEDMDFVLEEISRLGSDTSYVLNGLVDTVKCLMGHSMGGGSMFLAANMNKKVKAAVALSSSRYETISHKGCLFGKNPCADFFRK